MSVARKPTYGNSSLFIQTILRDGIAYYNQHDQKQLDTFLYEILAPSILSSSQDELETKENILQAAITQYKEKKQEAHIISKIFSKDIHSEAMLVLKKNILLAAVKQYEQTKQSNLIWHAFLFVFIAGQFYKNINVESRVNNEESKECSETGITKIKKISNEVACAVNDVFNSDLYPLFDEALYRLQFSRRFHRIALDMTPECIEEQKAFNTESMVVLDELNKMFQKEYYPFVDENATHEKIYDALESHYDLSTDMINEFVFPHVIARQANRFLREYDWLFLMLYPKLEPWITLALRDTTYAGISACCSNRLTFYNMCFAKEKFVKNKMRETTVSREVMLPVPPVIIKEEVNTPKQLQRTPTPKKPSTIISPFSTLSPFRYEGSARLKTSYPPRLLTAALFPSVKSTSAVYPGKGSTPDVAERVVSQKAS